MFPYSLWCSLPIQKRHEIALKFNIPKKGSTEVFSNTIKSDGYLVQDIDNAFALENVQRVLDVTETDSAILWSYIVDGLPAPTIEIVELIEEVKLEPTSEQILEEVVKVIEETPKEEKKDKIDVIKTPTTPSKPKKTYYKSKKTK